MDSLGINQANSLLKVMSILRERLWQLGGINYRKIHLDIDSTVETVFGNQQGGRKGHNTKYRGKKGLRPMLNFLKFLDTKRSKHQKIDTWILKQHSTLGVNYGKLAPNFVQSYFGAKFR